MGSSGAVDDSAHVEFGLRLLCEFAQPHRITNLLPNTNITD